jgi:hypothetical protein
LEERSNAPADTRDALARKIGLGYEVIENIWFCSAWAISGGDPFGWTITVTGFGGRTVLAETQLAQIVLPAGPNEDRWARAGIGRFDIINYPNPSSTGGWLNWNGPPIYWFSGADHTYFDLGIGVRGTGVYAWMIGKIYFFEGM